MLKYIVLTLALAALAAACAPAGTSDQKPAATASPSSTTAPAASFATQWKQLVTAAQQEKEVTSYTILAPKTREETANAFKKEFGINMTFVIGQPAEIAMKMDTERRAGLNLADAVIHGGVAMFASVKPLGLLAPLPPLLIHPDVLNEKAWRGNQLPYLDKDKKVLLFVYPYFPDIAINTDMVKRDQIKSWEDLLKPEWKGKIVMADPVNSGPGNGWAVFMLTKVWTPEKGEQYLRQLAKQDIIVNRDDRLQAEWLARGKYPVLVASKTEIVSDLKTSGAPVDFLRMSEGGRISTGAGCIAIPDKPAHPNAAKLLLNWLLTKDAQTMFARAYGQPSARTDVPAEGFDPALLPAPGENLHILDEDFWLSGPKLAPLLNDIFSPALK